MENIEFGSRNLRSIVKAPFQGRHYLAAKNIFSLCKNPLNMLGRYVFRIGTYPTHVIVDTPIGKVRLNLYSFHDVMTINEIFFRNDYPTDVNDKVIVDFGSNIGISAAFFLTRSPDSIAHLFEPLRSNTEKLRTNLKPFDGRYTLEEAAVGLVEGNVEFGWEETGRYGGIGVKTGRFITVPCRDSNKVLDHFISLHGHIDILKIDIETFEKALTERIPLETVGHIKKIYCEQIFPHNPLERTHRLRQYGNVAQFLNKGIALDHSTQHL
jgi:FkbM family methyltransferase